jgi:L-lactate permease
VQKHQNAKVVILCPIRALCQERVQDWSSRFGALGIKVIELSGDVSKPDIKEVSSAQVTTHHFTVHIFVVILGLMKAGNKSICVVCDC